MSRLGGWVRWIGCAAVWEAGRAVCGERHLRWTQAYSPTATEDDGVGRGNIHTYAIGHFGDVWCHHIAFGGPRVGIRRPSASSGKY